MLDLTTKVSDTCTTIAYASELVLGAEVFEQEVLVLGVLRVWLGVGDGQVVEDLLHVALEAHVNHLVSLSTHKHGL